MHNPEMTFEIKIQTCSVTITQILQTINDINNKKIQH